MCLKARQEASRGGNRAVCRSDNRPALQTIPRPIGPRRVVRASSTQRQIPTGRRREAQCSVPRCPAASDCKDFIKVTKLLAQETAQVDIYMTFFNTIVLRCSLIQVTVAYLVQRELRKFRGNKMATSSIIQSFYYAPY